jgi:hypothetical protein
VDTKRYREDLIQVSDTRGARYQEIPRDPYPIPVGIQLVSDTSIFVSGDCGLAAAGGSHSVM